MKEHYCFSRRFLMLVLLIMTCINIYSQRSSFKAIEKTLKLATKNATKAGEKSYKVGEKYTEVVMGYFIKYKRLHRHPLP